MDPIQERILLVDDIRKEDAGFDKACKVSTSFPNGAKMRIGDGMFEVHSCNDKKQTVTLKLAGFYINQL